MVKKAVLPLVCIAVIILNSVFYCKEGVKASSFTFGSTMDYEVFKSYLSRAVTLEGLCVDGLSEDLLFEEDLRMLRRIGSKYVASAAIFRDDTALTELQVKSHFNIAKKFAEIVHSVDSEIILEASLPVKYCKETVNGIKIPDFVYEAFEKPKDTIYFNFESMLFSPDNKSVLFIKSVETQMFLYYLICKYIDSGFEAVHLGNAVSMMNDDNANVTDLKKLLDLCRNYAKKKAFRKIVLFNSDTTDEIPVIKSDNNFVTDMISKRVNAVEYKIIPPDFTAKLAIDNSILVEGNHPLGYNVSSIPVLLKFENYSCNGVEGKDNGSAEGCYGLNEISWFASQSSAYRDIFLRDSIKFLKEQGRDANSNQAFFLLIPCKVGLTVPERTDLFNIDVEYFKGMYYHYPFIKELCDIGEIYANLLSVPCSISVLKYYRANKNSDGCPCGFSQEDMIRTIFLGVNVPENPELNKIILPKKYFEDNGISSEIQDNESFSNSTSKPKNNSSGKSSASKGSTSKESTKNKRKEKHTSFANKNGVKDETVNYMTERENTSDLYTANAPLIIKNRTNAELIITVLSLFFISSVLLIIYLKKKK